MKTVQTPLGPFLTHDTGTITRALEEGQWWDDHLKLLIDEVADPSAWAIDLGANIGWFSVYLSRLFKWVIAVEPNLENLPLLAGNLLQHGGSNVTIMQVAATDYQALLRPANAYGNWPSLEEDKGALAYVAAELTLPTVLGWRMDRMVPASARVALIKSDCQGADLKALNGLSDTIEIWRPRILFEWEEGLAQHQGHGWADYEAWARRYHYAIDRITTNYWDYVARPRRVEED